MRGWISRHDVGCFWISFYVVLLCAAEYCLISRFTIPSATTRTDWIIIAGFMAPLAALAVLLALMATGWLATRMVPRKTRKREDA